MATGRDPFGSEFVYEMLHHHLHHDPPPFAEVCPGAAPPRELEAVVRRAMAKNPADRFQTMADFKEELEKACLLAEKRLANEEAKGAESRTTAARTSTARMPALSGSSPGRPGKAASPCMGGGQRPFKLRADSNLIYVSLSLLLILAASVMAMRHAPSAAGTAFLAPSAGAAANKAEISVAPPGGKDLGPAKIAPVSFSSVAKLVPEHLSSHRAAHVSAYAGTRLTSRYGLQEHSQVRHSPIFNCLQHHPQVNSSSVKNSLPNASQLHVDQSKFQSLRDLKSPSLRQECGDLPQQ